MIATYKEVITQIDAEGEETVTTKEQTTTIQKNQEPDYIKIYTKMWCEFNAIPEKWHKLFFELATRMTYCNTEDLEHSQIVIVYGAVTEDICRACGWRDKSTIRKGLKALCDCGVIRKTPYRATYQISPLYASKGEWKYNPKAHRGGVEDLIATFNFKDGTVKTKIVWADDGTDSEINTLFRDGLKVAKQDETVLKTTTEIPGQMSLAEYLGEEVPV